MTRMFLVTLLMCVGCSPRPNAQSDAASLDDGAPAPDANLVDAGPRPDSAGGFSLRFFGNGGLYDDRVKVRIDDPTNNEPGPPADVGATNFTVELWMKANANDNPTGAISCGANNNWVTSNIMIDRDRHGDSRSYGVGVAGGMIVFGVEGDFAETMTICGRSNVLDDRWHHVAVQRNRTSRRVTIFVDGLEEVTAIGPSGDLSYPDDGVLYTACPAPGGLCDYSDPFLVFGAEKHGYPDISYSGLLDEVRLSTVERYNNSTLVPTSAFAPDADTAALYHFDEGGGDVIGDDSGAPGGPSDGVRFYGGTPSGPNWAMDTPF